MLGGLGLRLRELRVEGAPRVGLRRDRASGSSGASREPVARSRTVLSLSLRENADRPLSLSLSEREDADRPLSLPHPPTALYWEAGGAVADRTHSGLPGREPRPGSLGTASVFSSPGPLSVPRYGRVGGASGGGAAEGPTRLLR
jgi:hypothetical protein